MSIAVVSHTVALSSNGNNVTTGGIDTLAADLLIVVVSTFGNGTVTVSDSQGHTWTPRTHYGTSTDARVRIYYAAAPTGHASHTFTVTATGLFPGVAVLAVSGADTSSPYDVENGAGTTLGVTTFAPGSVTPSVDNELLVTGLASYSAAVSSIDSGFTIADSATYNGNALTTALAYKIQTSAGAENPTWTVAASSVGSRNIATFKAAAAGGGNIPRLVNGGLTGSILLRGLAA
jgi:hypothetical protein